MRFDRLARPTLAAALMITSVGCSLTGTGDARLVSQDENAVVIGMPEWSDRNRRHAEKYAKEIIHGDVLFLGSEEIETGKIIEIKEKPLFGKPRTMTVPEKEHRIRFAPTSPGH